MPTEAARGDAPAIRSGRVAPWMRPPVARACCGLLLCAAMVSLSAGRGAAQTPGRFVFAGEVRIGAEPADTGTVVLHRVSPTFTGSIDSVALAEGGRFEFAVEPAADADVYFASVHRDNVLYFGAPVTGPADLALTYVVQAYHSMGASADTRLPVRVRNVFLDKADPGPGWQVTDLFEVVNDTGFTIVSSEEGAAWSHALPPGAVDFVVGSSDVPPEGASFSGGRVFVSTPVPPGDRVYLFRYRIPEDDFTLPMEATTGSMEMLFREPAGALTVSGLAAVGPVELEGATFRRYAGREVAPSLVSVEPGTPLAPGGSMPLIAALLGLALAAAGSLLALRARAHGARAAAGRRREVLIDVARLDEAWHAGELAVEEYERRRRLLLRALEG